MEKLFLGLLFSMAITSMANAQQDTISMDTAIAKRCLNEAKDLIGKRQNDEAEGKLKVAGDVFEKVLGRESLEYADVLHQMGRMWLGRSNSEKSLICTQQALEIRVKLLGEENLTVARSFNNLGIIYEWRIEYEKAIEFREKTLSVQLKLLGKEHPDVALSYSSLGLLYYRMQNYDKAIENYEKILSLLLKLLGPEHLDLASYYNDLGVVYELKGEYEKGLQCKEKALDLFMKFLGKEHPDVASSFNNIGVTYDSKGEYDKAIDYYGKSLSIRLKLFGEKHLDVAKSYNNLGVAYEWKGEYGKALEYKEKALNISLKLLGAEDPDVANYYNNLGITYDSKGEYSKALKYKEKALNIRLKLFKDENLDIAQSYNNIGTSYERRGEYGKAIEYHTKSLSLRIKFLGEEHPDVAQSYNNLGNNCEWMKEYNRAIEYRMKSLNVFLKLLGQEHPDIATAYSNLGSTYRSKKEYDKSLEYEGMALSLRLKLLGSKHPHVAQAYNNLGVIYHSIGAFDKAMAYFSNAFESLKYQPQNIDQTSSVEELIRSLGLYNYTLQRQYFRTPDPITLQRSLSYSHQTLAVIDYQSSTFTSESSKIYWQTTYHPIYEQAIDISLLSADVNDNETLRRQTFIYAEKSKATQLQAQLKNADALAFSGIPDSLTQKEYQLRVDINWREKQRQGLLDQGKVETDSNVLSLSSILFDLRQQYDTLKKRFEKNFPEYYRLKYDLRTVPLQYVQDSLLQSGESLLEYFVGDSSIYLFLVQPKNYEVIKIKKDTAFEQWVEDLTSNGIYGFYGKKGVSQGKSINNFGKAAYQLYETLIAPIKAKLPEKGKLIIIPDGILGYVPFEALLTEKPPRPDAISAYKYLIQKHQISYCYSATLLKEMRDKKHRQEPTQKLLAMAPFFLGNADTLLSQVDSTELMAGITLRDTLTALPNSGEEVARIQKILKGQAFYGKAATMAQFQKLATQARILHLSTHAEADNRLGDYAYLAFSMPNADSTFDKLYVRDLYNLSLKADLVVLSACETGIGKLQRGEGIVSLARAFAYAGAKSIVTTLWKVSDEHSKNLMTSFYKYLSKGKDKDEALRLAKLDFLQKNEKKTELLHPFFWASFIGIGDMRGLENSK